MDLLKNGYQIAAGPGNGAHKAKELSRSGAKQENFIKTGKQNFKEINQKTHDSPFILALCATRKVMQKMRFNPTWIWRRKMDSIQLKWR